MEVGNLRTWFCREEAAVGNQDLIHKRISCLRFLCLSVDACEKSSR